MKRPRPSSTSILILLASLLSVSRSGSAQPSPGAIPTNGRTATPQQTRSRRATNDQHHPHQSTNALSAIAPDRATLDRAAAESAKSAAAQEANLRKQQELAAETLAVTQKTLDVTQQSLNIDGWLVKLTAGLAVINFLTMVVFYCTMRANVVAANATRDVVKVSKAAVRPYLWVRKVEAELGSPTLAGDLGPEFANMVSSASCFIQNLGSGPAFITEVVATLKFSDPPLPLPPNYDDCIRVVMLQPVVTATEPTNFLVRLRGGADSPTAIRMGDPNAQERFSCYGIIRYRDVFGEKYCTTFGFSRQWGRRSDSEVFEWFFTHWPPYNTQT